MHVSSKQIIRAALGASILSFLASSNLYAANNGNVPQLLNELSTHIRDLRGIEAQGQEIFDAQDKNRRDIARLDSEASALSETKSLIDKEAAQYKVEAEEYNARCVGTDPAGQALTSCENLSARLDTIATTLDARASEINPRVEDYNAQIDAFNQIDAELKRESEGFHTQYQEYERNINRVKMEFRTLASGNSRDRFTESVRVCIDLAGFEDTLTCLQVVWDREN